MFTFLVLLPLITALTPVDRPSKRANPRRLESTQQLVARGVPTGWSAYVASGNDGGACYVDSEKRILPDWNTRLSSSSVEIGLKTCRDRGYTWAGLQDYTEVYVSSYFDIS